MLVALMVIAAIGLLGAIVYGLRRYQALEAEQNAERLSPLPPLDLRSVNGLREGAGPGTDAKAADVHWLQNSNSFKQAGNYAAALQVCQAHYPQWGAFEQASRILRAEIRSHLQRKQPVEPLLHQLYLTAAQASLLHDKLTDLAALTPRQLKQLPDSFWQELDMPYERIGFLQLRLLGKSDHKIMSALWGPPAQHVSARQYHQDIWQQLLLTHSGSDA